MLLAVRCSRASLEALVIGRHLLSLPKQQQHTATAAAAFGPGDIKTAKQAVSSHHNQAAMAHTPAVGQRVPAAMMSPIKPAHTATRQALVSPNKAMVGPVPSPSPVKQASTSCVTGTAQRTLSARAALFQGLTAAHAQASSPVKAAAAAGGASCAQFSSLPNVQRQQRRTTFSTPAATATVAATAAAPLQGAAAVQLQGALPGLLQHQQQLLHSSAAAHSAGSTMVLETMAAVDDTPLQPQLHLASYALHQHSSRNGSNGSSGANGNNGTRSSSSGSSRDVYSNSNSSSNFAQPASAIRSRGLGEGKLHVITGPMFAGKSTALLQRVAQAHQDGAQVAVVKSSKDSRYARHWVVTHAGACVRCFTAASLSEFVEQLGPCYEAFDVVAIDEAQFFPDLVDFCQRAADVDGKVLLVAGLCGDFKRRPFGGLLDLVPLADSVTKLTATCHYCNSPDGHFSVRVVGAQDQEVVGGADKYRAACRRCYMHNNSQEEDEGQQQQQQQEEESVQMLMQ